MKQLVLQIPDHKYRFFMELIENMSFVKITHENDLTKKQLEFVQGNIESLQQVEKHMEGKIKLKSVDELLDEL